MNVFPTRILLATDGSEDATLAARAAAELSNKSNSELHIVHVWHDVPTPHLRSFVRAQLGREAQEVLEKQVERIEEAGGTVDEAHLREGRTRDEILDLSQELEVGLLVVGSRGLGELGRILLGSVSEGIIHHARRPVLVMRGGQSAWPPARVVIADDSSEHAKEAGELAASIGRLFGAEVVLVRVHPSRLSGEEDALHRTEEGIEQRADELEEILKRRPQIEVRQADDPAGAILEVA